METLREILDEFDKPNNKDYTEQDVCSALEKLISKEDNLIDEELKAEIMAFSFVENYKDKNTGWGTYYGPMFVWKNNDGAMIESPSINQITPQMIDYWEKRIYETNNPILKSRYSGLVWDFKSKISGEKPSHEISRLYIKAIIDMANGDFHKYKIYTYGKLQNALNIAISLKDVVLIEQVKNTILAFEKKYSDDYKAGTWGHSFDLLIENKKINLTESEENNIIKVLEERLFRLTHKNGDSKKIDPWSAEASAKRLASYYRKKQKHEDVKRVILEVGKAFEKISIDAKSIQAYGWLNHVYKLYIDFNLNKEAEELLLKMREIGPVVSNDLKPISSTIEVPKYKIDMFIKSMTTGSSEEIIERIIPYFIPSKEDAKEQLLEMSKKTPIIFHIPHQIQDEKGRVLATIGPLENDIEGNVVYHISNSLYFGGYFLREIINEAVNKKGLSKEVILDFLSKTPIIKADRFSTIDIALDAYFHNDHLVYIHLIIPQIEEAIRNFIEMSGGNVLKAQKGGGFNLKTLDELLREKIIIDTLGEDFANYLRIVLTDQRGWNIRNLVCHGIIDPKMLTAQTSDRLIHIILCLGAIRYN